jgi:hypothetical protein
MRFRIMWDLVCVAEGAVDDRMIDQLASDQKTSLVCSRPNTEHRIPWESVRDFGDAGGVPIAVEATRFSVEFIPDYMDGVG